MKCIRIIKRTLTALLCAAVALCCAVVPEPCALAEGDVLAVGVPVDRCPMFYLDADTGAVVGIGADLMRAAAAAAGYAVNFVILRRHRSRRPWTTRPTT